MKTHKIIWNFFCFVCFIGLVSSGENNNKIYSGNSHFQNHKDGMNVGYYSDYEFQNTPDELHLEKLQQSLKGKHIKATARHDLETIVEEKLMKQDSVTTESQMSFKIFGDLQDSFNFCGMVIEGGDYIATHLNGTPKTKPALMIMSGEVDIAILQSIMRPEIALKMSFLQPTLLHGKVTAFFRDPPRQFNHNFYLNPLSKQLWQAFIFTWMTILIVFLLSIKLLRKTRMRDYRGFANSVGYSDVICWVFSFKTQQGWNIDSSTIYFNLLALISRYTFAVIYGVYCGAIISSLSQGDRQIETLEDLINHKFVFETYDVSASMGSYLEDLIVNKKLRQKEIFVNKSQVIPSLDDTSPNKAFLYYWSGFCQILRNSHILDWFICEKLSAVPIELTTAKSAMVVKKNFAYRELFNYKIIQLMERGLNSRYGVTYERDAFPLCPKENRFGKPRNLGFQEVFTSFTLLIVTNVLACVFVILEIAIFKFNKTY